MVSFAIFPTFVSIIFIIFQVLEVHEHLERPLSASQQEEMDDDEKALVREMCNVSNKIFFLIVGAMHFI